MTALFLRSSGVGFAGAGTESQESASDDDTTHMCLHRAHRCIYERLHVHPFYRGKLRLGKAIHSLSTLTGLEVMSSGSKLHIICLVSMAIVFSESRVGTRGLTMDCPPRFVTVHK